MLSCDFGTLILWTTNASARDLKGYKLNLGKRSKDVIKQNVQPSIEAIQCVHFGNVHNLQAAHIV